MLQGRLQNSFIMYTMGYAHFVEYGDYIPNPDELGANEKPSGALILALQAVDFHVFES